MKRVGIYILAYLAVMLSAMYCLSAWHSLALLALCILGPPALVVGAMCCVSVWRNNLRRLVLCILVPISVLLTAMCGVSAWHSVLHPKTRPDGIQVSWMAIRRNFFNGLV